MDALKLGKAKAGEGGSKGRENGGVKPGRRLELGMGLRLGLGWGPGGR